MVFNAAAILNEQRFLEKCTFPSNLLDLLRHSLNNLLTVDFFFLLFFSWQTDGWGFSQLGSRPMGEGPGALKHQIIGTLHAATYMRGTINL
jgi:hypothetical protein